MLGAGLNGRWSSPVAGVPHTQILAMLDSRAFLKGMMLWMTSLR